MVKVLLLLEVAIVKRPPGPTVSVPFFQLKLNGPEPEAMVVKVAAVPGQLVVLAGPVATVAPTRRMAIEEVIEPHELVTTTL